MSCIFVVFTLVYTCHAMPGPWSSVHIPSVKAVLTHVHTWKVPKYKLLVYLYAQERKAYTQDVKYAYAFIHM